MTRSTDKRSTHAIFSYKNRDSFCPAVDEVPKNGRSFIKNSHVNNAYKIKALRNEQLHKLAQYL